MISDKNQFYVPWKRCNAIGGNKNMFPLLIDNSIHEQHDNYEK